MQAALAWVMGSRWRAAPVVFVLATLPLTGIFAAALLALVVLRRGMFAGVEVAAVAAAAMLLAFYAIGAAPMSVGVVVVITWLPVMVLAAVLRSTASQGRALALAGVLGCGAVAGVFAATGGDPAGAWEELLRDTLLPLFAQAGMPVGDDVVAALPEMARMMTGLAAAFWAAGHFATVAFGRWAQAKLYNPGGFGPEFYALRLDASAAAVAGVVFLAGAVTGQALLTNLALVMVVVYAVQGLAVMHGAVAGAGLHWAWLVPPYVVATVLPPYALALFAVVGYVDFWLDFRRRATAGD